VSIEFLLFLLAAYLIGSVNPATLLTHALVKRNIRDFGDGNPGSTNVFLHVNKVSGIFVFFLDAFKGFIPLFIASREGLGGLQLAIIGSLAIVGHNFPIFHGFKGGTGISSLTGGLIFFAPHTTVELIIIIFSIIFVLHLLKRKIPLNYSALEVGEAIGFISMLCLVFVMRDYTLRAYMLFSTLVVVIRRFEKVEQIARKVLSV
jgi:glycerol-3-phosphate acyltransferase PlsY